MISGSRVWRTTVSAHVERKSIPNCRSAESRMLPRMFGLLPRAEKMPRSAGKVATPSILGSFAVRRP